MGHTVKIIAPNVNSPEIREKSVYLFGKNKHIHLGGTQIDINIAQGKEREKLRQFMRDEHFDIIHYHTIWNPFLAFQVRWYSKSKNVATFHDTPAHSVIGNTIMPLVAACIFQFLDAVISVSRSQAKIIKRFSGKRVQIIPNGIDVQELTHNILPSSHANNEKFTYLFLGRLEPRKGLLYAIKAYETLRNKYTDIQLLVAGDGQLRAVCEQYVRDKQIKDVRFLGVVDDQTKKSLFRQAHVYLAPSLYGESFGIVLLEAMAVETAIVGFGNEGYLNLIEDQWQSCFPEPKNLEAFTAAAEMFYLNNDKRQQMMAWGLQKSREFDWSHIGEKIESVYRETLSNRNQSQNAPQHR